MHSSRRADGLVKNEIDDAEDDSNHCRFDNRVEDLVVVDAVLLGEATDDPTCLVTGKAHRGKELSMCVLRPNLLHIDLKEAHLV